MSLSPLLLGYCIGKEPGLWYRSSIHVLVPIISECVNSSTDLTDLVCTLVQHMALFLLPGALKRRCCIGF